MVFEVWCLQSLNGNLSGERAVTFAFCLFTFAFTRFRSKIFGDLNIKK